MGLNGTPCQWETIAEGIANAGDRDTVYVAAGNYTERPGRIQKSIHLTSASPDCADTVAALVVVNGRSREPGVFQVVGSDQPIQVSFDWFEIREGDGETGGLIQIENADVVLNASVLAGGAAKAGGCAYVTGGSLTVRGSTMSECSADNEGGGIYAQNARIEMAENSKIELSSALSGGAIAARTSQILLSDTELILNSASSDGGAIHLSDASSLLADHADIRNSQSVNGAGVFAEGSPVTLMNNSLLRFNSAQSQGGGLFLSNGSHLASNGADFDDNTAGTGAAIHSESCQLLIEDFVFSDNEAIVSGGAVFANLGNLDFSNGLFSSNKTLSSSSASGGGALAAKEVDLALAEVDFRGNYTEGSGGAIDLLFSSAEIQGGEFRGNDAARGGALRIVGSSIGMLARLPIQDTRFVNNGSSGDGGALSLAFLDVDLLGTTFDGNSALSLGGAVHATQSEFSSVDTVFQANVSDGRGGAVACSSCGDFLSRQTTFLENSAIGEGGALYLSQSSFSEAPSFSEALLENVRFVDNSTDFRGGAAAFVDFESIVIRGVSSGEEACAPETLGSNTYCSEFRRNTADFGGAIVLGRAGEGASFSMMQTALIENSAVFTGTAVDTDQQRLDLPDSVFFALRNVLVAGNSSPAGVVEAIYLDAAYQTVIDSTTITGNGGPALWSEGPESSLSLSNSILWDNDAPPLASLTGTTTELLGCNFSEPEEPGSWNLGTAVDPVFATDPERGDYRLDPLNSPLIDACMSGPVDDLDGGGRPAGAMWEPGAFEVDALESVQLLAVQPGQGVTTSE
ncbi:MAG: hypothetical protein QNJ40_24520, partial [Xanthomonadales bacterium]|nr:hypothetical protein [Xanthomonadales bacterium]